MYARNGLVHIGSTRKTSTGGFAESGVLELGVSVSRVPGAGVEGAVGRAILMDLLFIFSRKTPGSGSFF